MTPKPSTLRRGALGLGAALSLAAAPAHAQTYDDEAGLDDDERTLADEIPDVEIPDVRIGENDAVVDEPERPPPVAVFEEPAFAQEPPPREEPATDAQAAEAEAGVRVTGDITAIDLEDGSLEVDTDTQGTLRLSADRARLRQIAPGQSVSLTFVDRADGRWVEELEPLPAPAPPAEEPATSTPETTPPTTTPNTTE